MTIIESETYSRMVKKAGNSLGYCDPDTDPLVLDTYEVIGKPIKKVTKEGNKTVYPKARIVLLSNGTLDILQKGINSTISERDARRVLGNNLKRKLTKSLKL